MTGGYSHMTRCSLLSTCNSFLFTFVLVIGLLLPDVCNATPTDSLLTTNNIQDTHVPGNDAVLTPEKPWMKRTGDESGVPELVEKLEGFFMAANGSDIETSFYQNTVVFETPFMHTDYQLKHSMSDEELEKIRVGVGCKTSGEIHQDHG